MLTTKQCNECHTAQLMQTESKAKACPVGINTSEVLLF
jgi:hypothetical protein